VASSEKNENAQAKRILQMGKIIHLILMLYLAFQACFAFELLSAKKIVWRVGARMWKIGESDFLPT